MKKIFCFFMCVTVFCCGCARVRAEDALRSELDSVPGTVYAEADAVFSERAVRALLQNFSYVIKSCEEQDNEARAVVKITNVDMRSVFEDFERHAIENVLSGSQLGKDEGCNLLIQLLQTNAYMFVTKEVPVQLFFWGGEWHIEYGDGFYDALFGGFAQAFSE